MPTKSASKPSPRLDSLQIIALHVDLVTTAFRELPVEIYPSGAVEIDTSATPDDLESILRFVRAEGTIGSTFRVYLEGDLWNQIQARVGKRKGLAFLIGIFGEVVGRSLHQRLRTRGFIAAAIPVHERDYRMTQRELHAAIGSGRRSTVKDEVTNVELIVEKNGQVRAEFDYKSQHLSGRVPAEQVTKLVSFVLKK
jgi:hypothetical protein